MYIFESGQGLFPPKTYGEYKTVGEKIGSGAFGEIYLAQDKEGEKYALKLEKASCSNPQLYHEYKTLQAINNNQNEEETGIITVYDYFSGEK